MPKPSQKIVRAVRVKKGDVGRVIGQSLRDLRELSGLSLSDMAKCLAVECVDVSKIESHGDVQIAWLNKYVQVLGGALRIGAVFEANVATALRAQRAFETESCCDGQLVLPIFGGEQSRGKREVVLSVKPAYSDKIFEGKKTVELRRRFPLSAPPGTIAYIYSTSPTRAMVGKTEISSVSKLPVINIWKNFSKKAQISKPDFDSYFAGLEEGFVLKMSNICQFERPITLDELRNRFGFEPPQSFLYVPSLLRTALQNEHSKLSD